MEPLSGTVTPRIGEIADALWVDEDDIQKLNTYSNLNHIITEILALYEQNKIPWLGINVI